MVRWLVLFCSCFWAFPSFFLVFVVPLWSDPVPGIFEGGKYKSFIEKLVNLAERKRKPLQDELDRTVLRRDVLEESRRFVDLVQGALDPFLGVRNVFSTRVVESSNPLVATATAKRGAGFVDVDLVVKRIAKADQIYSDDLSSDYSPPRGLYEFVIGDRLIEVSYQGGILDDFVESLNMVDPDFLKASVVKNSLSQQVFLLSGQKTGRDMRLSFGEKTRQWALDVGLITDNPFVRYVVISDSLFRDLAIVGSEKVFDMKTGAVLRPGRYFEIRPDLEMILEVSKDSYLSFEYKKSSGRATLMYELQFPSGYTRKEAAREGFVLSSQNGGRVGLPYVPDQSNIYLNSDSKLIPLPPVGLQSDFTRVRVDVGQYEVGSIESIVLHNGGEAEEFEIKNLQIITPMGKDGFFPKNVASRAQDSEFLLNGVTVRRATNKVEDISPEFNLNLKSSDFKPVKIAIRPDIDAVINAVNDFVTVYNYYVSKLNIFTAAKDNMDVLREIHFPEGEERKKAEERLGLYQGDSQMIQMKRSLFFLMTEPYLVGPNHDMRLLVHDLGIHTNADFIRVGASSQTKGYFEVDQNKLREKLEMNWKDVRDLFASHAENMLIVDDGLAVKMRNYLRPFLGRDGLIAGRVQLLEQQIKRKGRAVEEFDEKLSQQKKKWESDFIKVQSAEEELERFKKQMDGFFFSGKSN